MILIDSHSHVLNFNYVPDRFFRSRAPVRERLFRRWWARRLVQAVSAAFFWIPGVGYRRLHQVLELLNKDIDEVAAALLDEMSAASPEIGMTCPLMMDLEQACTGEKPEVPYPFQIFALSRLVHQYPGRIMPFIMVDPRDPRDRGAAATIIDCLENHGFLGVKLYPPLGYHPDPTSSLNDPRVNAELDQIYAYCARNGVPVTAHCSRGGAYDQELLEAREVCRECAHPSNWIGVLATARYEGLRLNLAHFGGDLQALDEPGAWSAEILRMMDHFPNLYADVSYHPRSLRRKTRDRYFSVLKSRILDPGKPSFGRVLFGTDWPMIRHTWREEDYVEHWVEGCGEELLERIGFANAKQFLFGGRVLPHRYLSFLNRHGRTASDLPAWLLEAAGTVETLPAPHEEPIAERPFGG